MERSVAHISELQLKVNNSDVERDQLKTRIDQTVLKLASLGEELQQRKVSEDERLLVSGLK